MDLISQEDDPEPQKELVDTGGAEYECPETCHRICRARRYITKIYAEGGWHTSGRRKFSLREQLVKLVDVRRPHALLSPQYRYFGYTRLEDSDFSWPLQLLRVLSPTSVKVRHDYEWWLGDYALPKNEEAKWMSRLGLVTYDALDKHFRSIRHRAWQEGQELSIARWWFLRNRLQMSPYYSNIIELARQGASVADIGCGFGQDLRFLREDGAVGKLWGVDILPKMWELGNELFADAPGPAAEFIKIDLVCNAFDNVAGTCPLHVLHDQVDIFLFNDYLSFLGDQWINKSLSAIAYASKAGSKIVGWMFGTDQFDFYNGKLGPEILRDEYRGMVHHPNVFREHTWAILERETQTRWDLEVQLLEPEEFGFLEGELKLVWEPFPLKVFCFMATRLS